jgi:hypothetical protein
MEIKTKYQVDEERILQSLQNDVNLSLQNKKEILTRLLLKYQKGREYFTPEEKMPNNG